MSLTGFLSLYLCWSVSPQQPPSVSRVVCQNIDFEQIAPHCPGDTLQAPQQALAACRVSPPLSSLAPLSSRTLSALPQALLKPTQTQVLSACLPAKPYWNSPCTHSLATFQVTLGSGSTPTGEETPQCPRWTAKWVRQTLAVSARITRHPLPVPIGTPGPFQDCLLLECWRPPGPVPHFLPGGVVREGGGGDRRAQVRGPGPCRAGRPAWGRGSGGAAACLAWRTRARRSHQSLARDPRSPRARL